VEDKTLTLANSNTPLCVLELLLDPRPASVRPLTVMPASIDQTLLSDIISDGGLSKDEPRTDADSIPFDESLPATSIIHESFADHNIPPCPETSRIDDASSAYEMQRNAS